MDENRTQQFIKIIIKTSNKKAENENMTDEQKKEYINKKLFDHFEKDKMSLDEAMKLYGNEYTGFSKDEFKNYVIKNTKRKEILIEEKENVEKKIKQIDWNILQKDRELGKENMSSFEMSCISSKPISMQIEEVNSKYKIPGENTSNLKEEELKDYIDLIDEMIEEYPDVKDLHEMAREQAAYFSDMGEKYQETIKEKSSEYAEYIDGSIKKEMESILKQKNKIEQEKEELIKLKEGLVQCIEKLYDPRLKELETLNIEEEQR